MDNENIIKQIRASQVFNLIDIQFAEFICKKENSKDKDKTNLFLAALCISFYANLKHSVLQLEQWHGKSLSEFCGLDSENTDELNSIILNFSEFKAWPQHYSTVIGTTSTSHLSDAEEIKKPLVLDISHGLLYLNKYYRAEQSVIKTIKEKCGTPTKRSAEILEQMNKLFEDTSDKDNWQKVAAYLALRSEFCVISGGPGTGKTTTVGKILYLLLKCNPQLKIDLVAPTGKAADRLGEAIKDTLSKMKHLEQDVLGKIPQVATTIHRYLAYHGGTRKFRYNEIEQTDSDFLLIDEASMVDLPLFSRLLSALKPGCRIILLGDKDQLTAVETGNVLGDLTASDSINSFSPAFCDDYKNATGQSLTSLVDISVLSDVVVRLEYSYRFDGKSGVGQLAKLINNSRERVKDESAEREAVEKEKARFEAVLKEFKHEVRVKDLPKDLIDEFSFRSNKVEKTEAMKFFAEYKKRIASCDPQNDAAEILTQLNTFRILCATRRGSTGSDVINEIISKKVFNASEEKLYHGRCIMIKQNNRELNLFNGDVGVILLKNKIPTVYFPGPDKSVRVFSPTILPDYETAFAMTIHKSQGSEYQQILMILPREENKLLSRELIYTGITRAKPEKQKDPKIPASLAVEICCNLDQLVQASRNKTGRYSSLATNLIRDTEL